MANAAELSMGFDMTKLFCHTPSIHCNETKKHRVTKPYNANHTANPVLLYFKA